VVERKVFGLFTLHIAYARRILISKELADDSLQGVNVEGLAEHEGPRALKKPHVLSRVRRPAQEDEPLQQPRSVPFKLAIEAHAVQLRHPQVTQDEIV